MSGSSRNRDDISSLPVYLTGEMSEGIPRLRLAFQRCRATEASLGWAQHVAGVRKTDSVPATMRLDNGSRPIVSLAARPIAL